MTDKKAAARTKLSEAAAFLWYNGGTRETEVR